MDQIQAAAQGQGDHRQAHRGEPRHLSSPPPGFLETVAALPITHCSAASMGFPWSFRILAYFIATLLAVEEDGQRDRGF